MATHRILSAFMKPFHLITHNRPATAPRNMLKNARFDTTVRTVTTREVYFEDVRDIGLKSDGMLIDVREPDEVRNVGKIPHSVNIPLGDIEKALSSLSDSEFEQRYGCAKPKPNTYIVFHCMVGKRSHDAMEAARKLGYSNAYNYVGSWNDWQEKIKTSDPKV